jgi:hypothetical protein
MTCLPHRLRIRRGYACRNPALSRSSIRGKSRVNSYPSHHNYYEGRADADLTAWLTHLLGLLADVFGAVRDEALRLVQAPLSPEPEYLRRLDHRARLALGLFTHQEEITTSQVASVLGLSERMARNLLQEWVADGWIVVADPSRRKRAYGLSAIHRQFIGNAP